jgi:AcrR family transcriptional regulator
MAEPRRAQNTPEAAMIRSRVLAMCLELFNEHGFSSVTIAQIALALGMNEGHLHYYFQTKQQIVVALFDDFERGAMAAASHGFDAPDRPGRYVDYLQNWFLLMWRYRFVYRDHRSLHRVAPTLQQRIANIYQSGQAQLRLVLDDMAAAGLLVATSDERAALMVNAWIVASYWIDYLTISRTGKAISTSDLAEGIHQVNRLFAPYLATGRIGAATVPMAKKKAR